MADNIFDATLDVDNDVKVNNFDWSHANNLTTQIGRITPIFCDLVPAKTSFRVNPCFGLQLMPMVFPIQTRMKARISFFRYPLRALWKDYKDFVGNFREGLEEPYIDFNTEVKLRKMGSTGSLGDYLGLPTTLFGDFGNAKTVNGSSNYYTVKGNQFGGDSDFTYLSGIPIFTTSDRETFLNLNPRPVSGTTTTISTSFPSPGSASVDNSINVVWNVYFGSVDDDSYVSNNSRFKVSLNWASNVEPTQAMLGAFASSVSLFCSAAGTDYVDLLTFLSVSYNSTTKKIELLFSYPESSYEYVVSNLRYTLYLNLFNRLGRRISGNDTAWYFGFTELGKQLFGYNDDLITKNNQSFTVSVFNLVSPVATYYLTSDKPIDLTLSTSPWYNSLSSNKDKQQKILAYAFRAYEGVYNSYFRDNRNNPYYLNGQVQYNTWIPTDAGGLDDTLYELRYANWEKDFLTTAVQSPQQGNAPLVGITTYVQTVANDDGTRTELVKTALVDEDGKKYGLSFKTSDEGLEGVEYLELDNGTAVRQARSLYDLATSGISIPDLRMVNCYQKFLELNMRKGYSYKDIVEGRFAVKVRYADLLLPEFFGGVSRDIDVSSITQTVDQNVQGQTNDYDKALGSQAGLAGVRGEANANIECFCDEESIIIGLLVVTPLPVYTQLLPKHFTYRGLMEHYQPEFNLIGFQPIKYNEVCPIQAYNSNPDTLTQTFGYNRPWYEYVQKYDVAHGLFRTDLSNFLMHRVFNEKPELAQSFLLVDPEQVTDVFAVTQTTDKIYGQIWLDCTCKLPIARVAIPRLD